MAKEFYVRDNRDGKTQGPLERDDAMDLCAKLNEEAQKTIPVEQRKQMRQRDARPFTYGTKKDFARYGKIINAAP